jgi:hypothetical protein
LFGRINYKNLAGRKTAYYSQGLLDSVRFHKDKYGQVYIFDDVDKTELASILEAFGNITIETVDISVEENEITTGCKYWEKVAESKRIPFRIRRRPGRKWTTENSETL